MGVKVTFQRLRRPRCSCCECDAVVSLQIRHSIFRGDDDHFYACVAHEVVARNALGDFEREAHATKQRRRDAGKQVVVQPPSIANTGAKP